MAIKKWERCEEPENSTTQEESIQAFPISGRGPVPSAASGTTSSPVPIADKPTCDRQRDMVSVVQIHTLPQADKSKTKKHSKKIRYFQVQFTRIC
jgi:hypothetical protein